MARKGQISLQKIHLGKFVGDGVAYETVTAIPGALNAKISVSESSETFYADDVAVETINTLESVEIEIEVAGLTLEEQALFLGGTVVKGAFASNVNDIATRPYTGLTFRSQKGSGAWRYISIPKIKWTPIEEEFQSKEDKVERKTVKVVGTAIPLESGIYKVTCDSDAEGVDNAYLDSFLTTIPQDVPTAAEAKTSK